MVDDGRDLTDELAAAVAFLAENNPGRVVTFAQEVDRMSRPDQLALINGHLMFEDKPKGMR
jgi:hypothetical protein